MGLDIADAIKISHNNLFNTRYIRNSSLAILVTDGGSSEAPALSESYKMKNSGIRLATIGVGNGVNESLLSGMASSGDYYKIDSIDKLADIFKTIISSIQKA